MLSNWQALCLAAPLLLAVLALVVYPLGKLAWDSITLGDGFANYANAMGSQAARRALGSTIVASLVVTFISVVVGFWISWYLATTQKRWLNITLWIAVMLPFWLGTIVKNYAIVLILASNGALNGLLGAIGVPEVSLLYTRTAVIVGMVYTMIPFATISMFAVVRSIDPQLIAAARSMGASRWRAMREIALPLAIPGFVASGALVFALSIGFYVTPVLLGGAQSPFIASVISANVLQFFNYPVACAMSVILLLVAFTTIGVALLAVGRERLVKALA